MPGRKGSWVVVMVAVLLQWPCTIRAQEDAATPAQQRAIQQAEAKKIDSAVKQLIEEAANLETFDKPTTDPRFDLPHPALVNFGSNMALPVLAHMTKPFTGNNYRDTYIRWHLMEVVNKANQADRAQMGKTLIRLVQGLPSKLAANHRQEYYYEPKEIAARYHQLRASTQVRVGYPPFDRFLFMRDGLPHVSPERRANIEAIIPEIEKLATQFKTITDQEAIAFNRRMNKIRTILREYRGKLIYAMICTGDPEIAKLVIHEIGKQTANRQQASLDMLAYLYLAAFDGRLSVYNNETLERMSRQLESIVKNSDNYLQYFDGDDPPSGWLHPKERNIADYAFHLIYLMRNPASLPRGEKAIEG